MSPDLLAQLGLAAGAAAGSGLRVYGTVAALGWLQRFGVLELPGTLGVLGELPVAGLATLALLHAGEPRSARHMQAALKALRSIDTVGTYAVSLKLLALAKAEPSLHRKDIRELARWLIDAQTPVGLWSYTKAGGTWDHSNSQYALLALHEADQLGVRVPAEVWKKARARVLATQLADGGWAYREGGESYGSMTAANVANLFILDQTLDVAVERGFRDGVAPRWFLHGLFG